jgi:hypothetical protein
MPDATYPRSPSTSERSEQHTAPSEDSVGIGPDHPSGGTPTHPGASCATETAPSRTLHPSDNPVTLRQHLTLLADANLAQLDALRRVDRIAANLASRPHDLISPLTVAA